MLAITVYGPEQYDEETEKFLHPELYTVLMEHSLVSLSKWEEKWEVPFLGTEDKTTEQVLDYVRLMLLHPEPAPDWISKLSQENLDEIVAYFDRKMTATWFNENRPEARSGETITAELVYYWMTTAQIPWEAQHWHLNKLFTLIKIFTAKNSKPKPMGRQEAATRRRELNRQRLKEMEGGSNDTN